MLIFPLCEFYSEKIFPVIAEIEMTKQSFDLEIDSCDCFAGSISEWFKIFFISDY